MELITGHAGENHISSDDDAAKYAALFGSNGYVLDNGVNFRYTIESNNLIVLEEGEAIFQGRHARTKPTERENCIIENGTQTLNRHDLIGILYENSNGIESASIRVIKGTAASIANDPNYTTGNIESGATQHFMPLYRVVLNGLNIEKVEKMFVIRYKMPIFLPPGVSAPTADMAPTDDVYVYFQLISE